MFAKVFNQIFDSSIAEDYNCRRMFMDLLVLADPTGAVDMTHEAIARRTNVPYDQVVKYIAQLCQPDAKSRSQLEEGKRLMPLEVSRDWGWRIVNYQHYRKLRDEEARRSYFRGAMRKYRASKKKDKQEEVEGEVEVQFESMSKVVKARIIQLPEALKAIEGFEDEWLAFIAHRKAKKRPMTKRAAELILKELAQRPSFAVKALQLAIVRCWTGFEWDWFDNSQQGVNGAAPATSKNAEPKQLSVWEIEQKIKAIDDRLAATKPKQYYGEAPKPQDPKIIEERQQLREKRAQLKALLTK